MLHDPSYQQDLPGAGEPVPPPEVRWEESPSDPAPERAPPAPSGGGAALQVLLWVVLAATLVVLGAAALRGYVRRRAEASAEAEPTVEETDPAAPAPPGDHERLAGDGRYAEAIRAILLATLEALRVRTGVGAAIHLTSREILDAARLPEAPRGPQRQLVGAVERVVFAGRAADAGLYRTSVAASRRIDAHLAEGAG